MPWGDAPPFWGRAAASAVLIGGVPVLTFLGFALAGWLGPGPAMLGASLSAMGAVAVAVAWLGYLARLNRLLRRALDGQEAPPPSALPLPPAMREAADAASRLARILDERSALVGRLRRADTAILESLPDPLLVLAEDRTPLRANRAARQLFGVPAADTRLLSGDTGALLRHPALAGAVDRALAEGRVQAADLVLPVPFARELAAQVIPLDPPLADGGRLIVQLVDRTRERAVERMRADFVANASHELRTPLASLIGFIETLRGPAEDDPEARRRFLGIMAEQSERMRRLIDDLLGLSRIELLEHQAPTGAVRLAALARSEAEAMTPILAARQVTLELDLDEEAIASPADSEQLGQVLRNLLENAVRHGRQGGVVRLGVRRAEGARPGAVLEVADDGPGIPREHIPRLTERFYRLDKGRSRNAGGTGLGLAIVKHIVNRHRGQLLIESEDGQGAVFRVWLPAG
ncbi:ATP-binding protein [Roseomonas marmotae]|uniref:histidine kinase n=1 Tax=Roseomonas marmotae TaxID=2768161 RepID=A0ABS3KCV3_9PROT|nr:ATP-binding protein [Roseomonas marmotae]MBO1075255.1 PAS domain-containing protein [Roseomonas marmotae]QTI79642.1 PAS domain-containing protein [Roseomonas marmotae]